MWGSWLGQRASKSACLVVPPLFRADSGTNLFKQGENVKGRPSGSVAQLAECSHGKREALGSSPGRVTIFSSPVTIIYVFIEKLKKMSHDYPQNTHLMCAADLETELNATNELFLLTYSKCEHTCTL